MDKKHQVLKTYFGYDRFREGQRTLIDAILEGRDVLGVMPTGAGKSLCFQVPALMLPGITLVISPLISLMKDQVGALVQAGVPAAYLNSSLTEGQYLKALRYAREGRYKIIYVAPERLVTPGFAAFVRQTRISLVAVDEAHCVSQWGQDFRPGYLGIAPFIAGLPDRPAVAAFTATATPRVKDDIVALLAMTNPLVLVTGFDRPNLFFEVLHPRSKKTALAEFVDGSSRQSGIIYCATRKGVEEVCDFLTDRGVAATRYHAGLSDQERRDNQDDFLYDRRPVMVATNAFGMGIDKSNVRYVVHYNMPSDLESYYQEAGRAGRDGEAARCVLLFGSRDISTCRYFIEHSRENEALSPQEREQGMERDRERLRAMTVYCHTRSCLREYILSYFGEQAPESCGSCSNCLGEFEQVDITDEARIILHCVREMGERFGITAVVDVLRGVRSQRTRQQGFDELPVFGLLAALPGREVEERIRALVEGGQLIIGGGQYPVLALGSGAAAVMAGREEVAMRRPKVRAEKKTKRANKESENPALFEELRALRAQIARSMGVPAFVIFSDATLRDMCRRLPRDEDEMLAVSGVGMTKLRQYGERFLAAIEGFAREG